MGAPNSALNPTAAVMSYNGVRLLAAGRLYIADTNNHRVCVADLASETVATLPLRRPEPS